MRGRKPALRRRHKTKPRKTGLPPLKLGDRRPHTVKPFVVAVAERPLGRVALPRLIRVCAEPAVATAHKLRVARPFAQTEGGRRLWALGLVAMSAARFAAPAQTRIKHAAPIPRPPVPRRSPSAPPQTRGLGARRVIIPPVSDGVLTAKISVQLLEPNYAPTPLRRTFA